MIPCELNPAATKRLRTSAVSPRQKFTSGVKDSGARRYRVNSACSSAGIRRVAFARVGEKCSQSGPNSPNAQSSGIDAVERGRPFGSNAPIISPPAWWRA